MIKKKNNTFDSVIGTSDVMVRAKTLARKGAKTNVPILLSGDSGVGKEIFARAIHMKSDRSEKPFVVVNCGALPENLVESILFGHVKGALQTPLKITPVNLRKPMRAPYSLRKLVNYRLIYK